MLGVEINNFCPPTNSLFLPLFIYKQVLSFYKQEFCQPCNKTDLPYYKHSPSNLEPGTFNCSRKICNTCPFINSKTHIRGPNGSYQVNDHFDCTTSNIIYCITCTLCNKLYIGESGRKLGDRFREHLLDVKNKGSDLSKPVARHFNLPGHSHEHMEICGIYLHLGNNETRKRKEQRLIFKLGTLAPNGINERFSFA